MKFASEFSSCNVLLIVSVVFGTGNPFALPLQVKPPRLKESALQLECKLKHIYDTTNA